MRNGKENRQGYRGEESRPLAFSVQDEIRRNRRIRRNRNIRKAQAIKRKAIAFILCVAAFAVTFAAVLFAVTRVQHVTVEGNARYSVSQILKAADIDGDVLPFLSNEAVYKKVVSACPYISEIELTKDYPSSVRITVTETSAVYCANIHDRVYSLDAGLRVIEFVKDTSGLVLLRLPEVVSAIEGQRIVFADSKFESLIPELLATVFFGDEKIGFTEFDVSNRFSISGLIEDSVKVAFGDYNDFSLKLKAAKNLIGIAEEQRSERTLINVSTLSGVGPSMIPDYTGDF